MQHSRCIERVRRDLGEKTIIWGESVTLSVPVFDGTLITIITVQVAVCVTLYCGADRKRAGRLTNNPITKFFCGKRGSVVVQRVVPALPSFGETK